MKDQMTFKRYELKYMLTIEQQQKILKAMANHMKEDPHGHSTIQSLYFDTPDFLLIRRSIDKPAYKEKLRLRSYGVANEDTKVFLELKKKYDKVVYKRRISSTESQAINMTLTYYGEIQMSIFILEYMATLYSLRGMC